MTAPVHHLEMHADRGEITLRLVCNATPDATCRRRPTNPDAETWTDDDETTPGHDCWAVEWIDNGGWDSITWGPETGTIASAPVDVSYDHRGVLAEPVTLPDPADLLPVTADDTYRPGARVTTQRETLDLPDGTVLRLAGGLVAARTDTVWGIVGYWGPQPIREIDLPAEVLFRPDAPQPAVADDAVGDEIRQATPNGRHMEVVPAHHTARTTRTKEQP